MSSEYGHFRSGYERDLERTPISEADIAATLLAAYHDIVGQAPPTNLLAGAFAHVAVETDHGANMCNHNFGNVTTESERGPHFFTLGEPDPKDGPYGERRARLKFLHFETPTCGARAYWAIMHYQYAPVLDLFRLGKFLEAVSKLFAMGYCEVPPIPHPYGGLVDVAKGYRARVHPILAPRPAEAKAAVGRLLGFGPIGAVLAALGCASVFRARALSRDRKKERARAQGESVTNGAKSITYTSGLSARRRCDLRALTDR